jgi:hypothetical protein
VFLRIQILIVKPETMKLRRILTGGRESLGLELSPGARHYRAYIGYAKNYDLIAAKTFGLLTTIGLRQNHKLVDIGCGSLRIGRLLIPYLNVGNYSGIEQMACQRRD